nr:hypothetical protein [Tanacetum cinerariifolium]
MKYQALKRKPLTEAQARRNMIIYLKNMAGYKMNYFKGMSNDDIRPLFEKHYNYNQAFLNDVNEGIKVPEREVRQEKEVKVESYKREGKSLEQEIAKKQNIEQETEELKKCLQIVPDDDDDVYADATPLASNIPIIDYKIHTKRNIPYFKIIRADGNHKKDLKRQTEPKNYSDDFLLNTLKTMFEKPNVEANVWKDQKGKYGLAKMYPLTHFTLEQMVKDLRLEVDDESEMYLELLRLVRRQLNEGIPMAYTSAFIVVVVVAPSTERTRMSDASEDVLNDFCESIGEVIEIQIMKGKDSSRNLCFCDRQASRLDCYSH